MNHSITYWLSVAFWSLVGFGGIVAINVIPQMITKAIYGY